MLYNKRDYSKKHNEFDITSTFKWTVNEKISHIYYVTFPLKHIKLEYQNDLLKPHTLLFKWESGFSVCATIFLFFISIKVWKCSCCILFLNLIFINNFFTVIVVWFNSHFTLVYIYRRSLWLLSSKYSLAKIFNTFIFNLIAVF